MNASPAPTHPKLAAIVAALSSLFLAACDQETVEILLADNTPPVSISVTIGPAGGTITSGDAQATLTIPAGAVPADTEITITRIENDVATAEVQRPGFDPQVTVAYRFEPEGLQFQQPATLRFEIPASAQQPNTLPISPLISLSDGRFEALGDQTLTSNPQGGGFIQTGSIEHFSLIFYFQNRFQTGSNESISAAEAEIRFLSGKAAPNLLVGSDGFLGAFEFELGEFFSVEVSMLEKFDSINFSNPRYNISANTIVIEDQAGSDIGDLLEDPNNEKRSSAVVGFSCVEPGLGDFTTTVSVGMSLQAGLDELSERVDVEALHRIKCNDEGVALDNDGDGVSNVDEQKNGSDPEDTDTDDDGLNDQEELDNNTDSTRRDSDGDGLTDGEEVNTFSTDPLDRDTDGDSLIDGFEVTQGTNPNNEDTDNDGCLDNEESAEDAVNPDVATCNLVTLPFGEKITWPIEPGEKPLSPSQQFAAVEALRALFGAAMVIGQSPNGPRVVGTLNQAPSANPSSTSSKSAGRSTPQTDNGGNSNGFSNYPSGQPLVAVSNGTASFVKNLATDENFFLVHDSPQSNGDIFGFGNVLDVLAITLPPGGPGNDAAFVISLNNDNTFVETYDADFERSDGTLGGSFGGFRQTASFDANPTGGSIIAEGFVMGSGNSVTFGGLDTGNSSFNDFRSARNFRQTSIVSAAQQTIGGPAIAIGRNADKLFHAQVNSSNPIEVADMPRGQRKLRCKFPFCVSSNFGGDGEASGFKVILWPDEDQPPTLGDFHAAGGTENPAGLVGIDLIEVLNGDGSQFQLAAVGVGFNDAVVYEVLMNPDGSLIEQQTTQVPASCVKPAHALWVPDADGLNFAVSCFDSSNLFIGESQLNLGPTN